MKQYFYILLMFLIAGLNSGLSAHSLPIKSTDNSASAANPTSIDYKIIPTINHTWGYDIYRDGKKIIHQPNIPGMPGNEGFRKKSLARKTAHMVINKIEHGEIPPTVTPEELKELKAI